METRRTARDTAGDRGEQVKEASARLAPVVDHPTRRTRHFRTLKSTLGRSERDVLVVLRRKLAAAIDAGNVRSAAMAALVLGWPFRESVKVGLGAFAASEPSQLRRFSSRSPWPMTPPTLIVALWPPLSE